MPGCLTLLRSLVPFLSDDTDCASVVRHEPVPRGQLPALLAPIDTRDEKHLARLHKEAQKSRKRRKKVEAKREKQKRKESMEEWKINMKVLEDLKMKERVERSNAYFHAAFSRK
ncbi:hypothetical protein BGX38DRAFT_1144344 [Terfezia claveryi]|nr:hypothetical protein BGX38DRAFT_1144344 [Terfezia claveryi]